VSVLSREGVCEDCEGTESTTKEEEIMPSVSQAQQRATAIAEHEPEKLYAKNKGLLKMSHKQLHDFASTPRKGLPARMHKLHKKRGKP
jgi:hypothetical protein